MKKKRIAIVTGASSGFGKIFTQMAEKQFDSIDEFWLIGRNADHLIQLSNSLSKKAKILPYDLSKMNNLRRIKELLEAERPSIKFLVNSAGFGITGHVEYQDEESLANMINVNCRALTYLCRTCIPFMRDNSRIVNFASVAAFMPQPSFAVYAASKSYVLSFSRALKQELGYKNIHVLAVCPGPADTNFFDSAERTGRAAAGCYKDLFMVNPEFVVEKAIHDSILKKELSVYSIPMKGLHVITKVFPRKMIFSHLK